MGKRNAKRRATEFSAAQLLPSLRVFRLQPALLCGAHFSTSMTDDTNSAPKTDYRSTFNLPDTPFPHARRLA